MIPLDKFRNANETEGAEEASPEASRRRPSWWERRNQGRKDRDERVEDRRNYRLDKIAALTKKFYAVATKRKWLVFMMALGIIIYFIVTSGGGMNFLGIFNKFKGFFGF